MKRTIEDLKIFATNFIALPVLCGACILLYLVVALTFARWKQLVKFTNYLAEALIAYIIILNVAEYNPYYWSEDI